MSDNGPIITIYADYVCPFCYLGRQSLRRYEATRANELRIEWHPFDLRGRKRRPDGTIDHSIDDGKDEQYYEQAKKNVERLREEYGADEMLTLDDVPDPIDSLDAQVASTFVQREHPDRWRAIDAAIYEALWVDGRDIGDVEVLVDLAENAGIDGHDIREGVEDSELRESVRNEFQQANRRGITAVPTFVHDGRAARGAVPPEQLRRLVEGS